MCLAQQKLQALSYPFDSIGNILSQMNIVLKANILNNPVHVVYPNVPEIPFQTTFPNEAMVRQNLLGLKNTILNDGLKLTGLSQLVSRSPNVLRQAQILSNNGAVLQNLISQPALNLVNEIL